MNKFGRNYPNVSIFRIEESWKGLDSSMSTIKIYETGTSCDVDFQQDSSYIVYGRIMKMNNMVLPIYFAHVCSPTIVLSKAKLDLDILGISNKHLKPLPIDQKKIKQNRGNEVYMFPLIGSLLINILLLILLIRIKRKNSC